MNTKAGDFMRRGMQFMILIITIVAILTIANDTNAQSRRGGFRGGFGHSPRFNSGFVHGSFFAPHIGARFTILPYGYLTYWIGGVPFYYYNGWWFQYYPADGIYMVVNKPTGADSVLNSKFDQLKLNDGSVVEGVFEGATDSTITMRVSDKDVDFNINNIISINFAQAVHDTTKPK
jgi:hypothetical protein